MKLPPCKTKLVCTIGPASDAVPVIRRLLRAGMNVARLNFSHGDFDGHARVIGNLREAARAEGRRLAIMADLPGPKIRIGELDSEPVTLRSGRSFVLTAEPVRGDSGRVSVTFDKLPDKVSAGDRLFLNDGMIVLEVTGVSDRDVTCRIKAGGELRSRKGLNLPGIDLGISAFTGRDHDCLMFAMEQGIDAVSQSFVESAGDIEAVRSAADRLGYRPFIIAKIERSRALANIDAIVDSADGLMVARGDLGVEIPIERIALVQKELIHKATMRGKPVITATQMLESMTASRRPTRAEATDVANAVLDGTDCVMLSAESALGAYPVESTDMLARIAAAAEQHLARRRGRKDLAAGGGRDAIAPMDLIFLSVEASLRRSAPAAVFAPTRSGYTARGISRFRLPVWIVAVSAQAETCQSLQFSWGVHPVQENNHPADWNAYIRAWVAGHELAGDLALLTEGPSDESPDTNNRLEIIRLAAGQSPAGRTKR